MYTSIISIHTGHGVNVVSCLIGVFPNCLLFTHAITLYAPFKILDHFLDIIIQIALKNNSALHNISIWVYTCTLTLFLSSWQSSPLGGMQYTSVSWLTCSLSLNVCYFKQYRESHSYTTFKVRKLSARLTVPIHLVWVLNYVLNFLKKWSQQL